MADYWVSQAKHFCKYCKIWIHDNKVSIKQHEGGMKHKQAVEQFFKDKREKKLQGAISENELEKQLREIEKAAREQAAQDAALFGGAATSALPPPPPPRPGGAGGGGAGGGLLKPPGARRDGDSGYKEDEEEAAAAEAAAKAEAEAAAEEEVEGRYEVDGVVYLDCKHHGEKLVTGVPCQIWLEAEDRWIEDASVQAVTVTAVPNTDIVLRKCTVAYRLGQGQPLTVEEEVNADRLRLLEAVVAPKAPEPPPVDEKTGLGGWQTVAVRVVDEEAERRAGELAIAEEAARKQAEAEARRLQMMADALEGEDALSSYDPYGRGVYKGVDLRKAAGVVEAAAEVDLGGDKDGPVAFKKRKAGGAVKGGGNRRKKTRDDEEDD